MQQRFERENKLNVGQLRDLLNDYSVDTELFTIDFEPIGFIEITGDIILDDERLIRMEDYSG